MTAKNFNQMSTKKLNALLATANDEDKAVIEEVLAVRELAQAPAEAQTPAEAQAPAEAQTLVKKRLTDKELHELAESLKININHRCQVVPFNTIDWVGGYIAGVVEEKRSGKVLYAIKTDDGRRIVKVHDSNLIRIFDETVEPVRKARTARASAKAERVEWTPELIAEEVSKIIGNVGKIVEFEKYSTTNPETGEEQPVMVQGRIVAITPDPRTQRLIYRINVAAPIEGNPFAVKVMHKVAGLEGLNIAEDFDDEGFALNQKYCARREAAAARTPLTPQDRVLRCEEAVKKAEEKLQKATTELEAKKKQLEGAQAELEKELGAQPEAPAEPAVDENDPLA